MECPKILILEDTPRTGLENMAIDNELLLEQTEQSSIKLLGRTWDSPPIILRFYYWSEPTLSLGNFQSIDQLPEAQDTKNHDPLLRLPWVKRKTGGGAILHEREITYSITIGSQIGPSALAGKGHSEQLYRSVHESVVEGLRHLGVQAQLSESCTCKPQKSGIASSLSQEKTEPVSGKVEPFLCFHRRTPVDVVVGAHKVLGSAQRRVRSGLLQHGSLLLANSTSYPSLLGLADLAELPAEFKSVYGSFNSEGYSVWQSWLESRILEAFKSLIGPPEEVIRLNSKA